LNPEILMHSHYMSPRERAAHIAEREANKVWEATHSAGQYAMRYNSVLRSKLAEFGLSTAPFFATL
jgi:hypothetical protein